MRLTSYLTRGLTAVTLGFVVSSAFAADLTPAPVNDNLNAVLWDQTSVEFKANAPSAYALGKVRLDEALAGRCHVWMAPVWQCDFE